MSQQLHTSSHVYTNLCTFFLSLSYICHTFILRDIKIEIRTGGYINTKQASQTYIIFQIYRNIKTVLFRSITISLHTFLRKQ